MIGETWVVYRPNMSYNSPPKNVIIKAYGYHDQNDSPCVGYYDEIIKAIHDDTFVWKLTGIGKEQLNNYEGL